MKRPTFILFSLSLMLITGAVIPASWDPPLHRLPRPEIRLTPPGPRIAFTFDDGPHAGKTEALLSILQDEGVPATFFVVGKMADRYPELIQDIHRRGHELANHTYTHPSLTKIENDVILDELDRTRKSIQQITGKDPMYYRPPGGVFNRRTIRCASQAGYRMVLWSVLTRDVAGASESTIYKRIMDGATDGGIVLMHSGIPATMNALPHVIRDLRLKGFQFVTVSELLDSHSRPPSTARSAPAAAPIPLIAESESSLTRLALLR